MTYTREQLSQTIERYIGELQLSVEPENLYAPIRYTMEEGGKRIRPLLALMVCDALGGKIERALPMAAAVEVLHNFSLLHDDIMDNAATRRGRDSVFKRWGANAAILSGDMMVFYAYSLLSRTECGDIAPILQQFNLMGEEVCRGQQYDMDFEERSSVTEEEYLEMIALKTCALIARPAVMGAMVAEASAVACQKAYDFGYNLGLAFQIQDDLLDTYGDEVSLGKRVGGDIVEGKKSFLTVMASKAATEAERTELETLLADKNIDEALKIERVKMIYNRLDVRTPTESSIREHIDRALEALADMNLPEDKGLELKELALSTLKREK